MEIEQVRFQLGQMVRFVLNPSQRGQIVSIQTYADGGCRYNVNWFSPDGNSVSAWFFACELDLDG